jgi:hypothetical protein
MAATILVAQVTAWAEPAMVVQGQMAAVVLAARPVAYRQ